MEWYAQFPPSKILDYAGQRLYIGNIYNAMELTYRNNSLGIQAVLDVSTEDDYEQNPEIMYLRVPFPDGHEIPSEKFAECMDYLTACWISGFTILVNCAAGISRSTSIVCSFIHHRGIGRGFMPPLDTLEKILDYVRLCRPIVQPAPSVFKSCKKHLKIWPYDGSLGGNEPPVKLDRYSLAKQMKKLHPNKTCPVRKSILNNDDSERHLLKCTCGIGE